MAADANDPTGQGQSFHIDGSTRHRVYKGRITKDGKAVGMKSKFELGNTITHEDQVEGLRLAKEEMKKKKDKRKLGEEEENEEEVEDTATEQPHRNSITLTQTLNQTKVCNYYYGLLCDGLLRRLFLSRECLGRTDTAFGRGGEG